MASNALLSRSQLQQQGFSLMELAVVLLIIGLIMSAGVKLLSVQAENAAYNATKIKHDVIKTALISYFRNHRRLPCPDSKPAGGNTGSFSTSTPPDGIENRNSTNPTPDTTNICDANVGIVPYNTLGLSRDVALDGWENFFTYRLYYPTSGATTNDWSRTSSFAADNAGAIIVNDRSPPTSPTVTSLTISAVVVLISHGRNGLGAYTIDGTRNALPTSTHDEYANTVGTIPNIKREISLDTSNADYGAFDDLITYFDANTFLAPLILEGSIAPTQIELQKDMNNISQQVLGFVLSNNMCTTPNNLVSINITGDSLNDPWGTPYIYYENLSEIQADGDAKDNLGGNVIEGTHIAYSITSAGPDRDPNTTADNIVKSYTAASLIGNMGGSYIAANCP